MSENGIVPELEIRSRSELEPVLPGGAEGRVDVWPGSGGLQGFGYSAAGYSWIHLPGLATFRFGSGKHVTVICDAKAAEEAIQDAYLRNVLPIVLQAQGHEVLHASAVRGPEGLVIFCGISGSGKSTLAYHLSLRGYNIWADDAVVVDAADGARNALPIPFWLKLRPHATAAEEEPLFETSAGHMRISIARIAVFRPPQQGLTEPVRVTQLTPANAFVALLPHAYYFQLTESSRRRRTIESYLHLSAAVPVYDAVARYSERDLAAVIDAVEADLVRS